MSPLPLEIWSHILKEVPKHNLSQLLGVCSAFHDIAIRYLFSSIKIYFIGGYRGLNMLNAPDDSRIEEITQSLMIKSWEILNHICQDPRFASIVRSITVIAFGQGCSFFEQLTVAKTLLLIPNLRTFRWIGVGPQFGPTVAECLPPTLHKLVIQSSLPLQSLHHLQRLESLHLSMPWFFPDDEEAHDTWTYDEEIFELQLQQPPPELIFETLTIQLKCLRITASQMRGIPIRILNNLLDLELFWIIGDEDEMVGFDLIFRHATLLQSLTIFGYGFPELFKMLPSSSSGGSLPHLTSFRLSYELYSGEGFQDESLFFLLGFLRNRRNLRRLYLRVPLRTWSQSCDLWAMVQGLLALEVLGVHFGVVWIGEEELRSVVEQLPLMLQALHLAFHCEASSLLPLVDSIGKLPRLSFLHLYGIVNRLPILLEDLIAEGKALQMIGLNRAIWNIERVGSEITTNKWPRWKTKFSVAEDFSCEDDAWLFEYN